MDFSWVRELAEQANQIELNRQEQERLKLEEQRAVAAATIPFVEKLYMLLNTCAEEFNKHMHFPNLRIIMSRFKKEVGKPPYGAAPDPNFVADNTAYFQFARRGWMFGVKGANGLVEFVRMSGIEAQSVVHLDLHQQSVTEVYTLKANLDREAKQVVWTMNGDLLDGPKLIQLCQEFFSDFIKRTNDQSRD